MSAPVRQANLSQGTRRLTAWIDANPKLRRGVQVTLKGESGRWTIDHLGALVLDRSALNSRWAVGGLS